MQTATRPPLAVRLTGVGAPVYAALRRARTAIYWMAEPIDRAHRILTGQRDLPPLWIRRHTGPVANYDRARAEMATHIALTGGLPADAFVLDVGCGAGAMADEFLRMLGPDGRYLGFDVHAPTIRWAAKHYARDPRVRFELAEIHTPYSARFRTPATEYRFPAADGSVDLAFAKSVFTHLLEPEARHYLRELARVLAPDGRALVTAFLLGVDRPAPVRPPLLEFRYGSGAVRHLVAAKPTAGVAYDVALFHAMVAEAGLRVARTDLGHWAGGGAAANGQDVLVLTR